MVVDLCQRDNDKKKNRKTKFFAKKSLAQIYHHKSGGRSVPTIILFLQKIIGANIPPENLVVYLCQQSFDRI